MSYSDTDLFSSCHDLARYQLMEGNTGLLAYRYMKAAQVSVYDFEYNRNLLFSFYFV
jgi:hypothetical protein